MNATEICKDLKEAHGQIAQLKNGRAQALLSKLDLLLNNYSLERVLLSALDVQNGHYDGASHDIDGKAGKNGATHPGKRRALVFMPNQQMVHSTKPQAQVNHNGQQAPSKKDELWLTSNEAALGLDQDLDSIGVNFVIRGAGIRHKYDGDCMLIPASELKRVERRKSIQVDWAMQRGERMMRALGMPQGYMTQREMDLLESSRPGKYPWQS